MGQLVFAGAMSHAPGIAAFPDAVPTVKHRAFFGAVAKLRHRLASAAPDVLVVIAPDHFTNFFFDNMPAFCLGLNDVYEGPVEEWLGIERRRIPGAPDFAKDLLETCFSLGIEPAFGENLRLEHSVMVPLNLLTPERSIPLVWLMQNCQVPPMPRLHRCYDAGRVIRSVIDRRSERVAILGTGGLSHAPGAPEADRLDEAFDQMFLAAIVDDSHEAVLGISEERMDDAGFGSWEIRQWVTVLGAAHDRKGRVLGYEAMQEWDTGCAVAIFE